MQIGFDFFENAAPDFAEQPAGAWLHPAFTVAEYERQLAAAVDAAKQLPPLIGAAFVAGAEAARLELQKQVAHGYVKAEKPFSLWRPTIDVDAAAVDAFIAACAAGVSSASVRFRVRDDESLSGWMTAAGVQINGIGALIMRRWPKVHSWGADYHVGSDPFFLDNYRDNVQPIYAPYATWGGRCCAHTLAEAGNSTASVPTVWVNGRDYVLTGAFSHRAYRGGDLWSFRRAEDWRGPTYDYSSQCRAWDEGRKMRGDKRGMLVKVRGRLCVLDGFASVYDDNVPDERACLPLADDESEDDVPLDGDAVELDEVEEFA